MTETETLVTCREGVGHILLNRPRVLNALSPVQYFHLAGLLAGWQHDPAVRLVVVEGAGERAFCAGGDIRAVWEAGRRGDHEHNRRIFRTEYAMNRRIHHFGKPYVALLDGIVMGGGAGISINGRYRVVTEHALFAMPEVGIGFFPDVGAGHFLARCPGRVGLYLGMTGARIGPADMVWAGLATHYVPRAGLKDLKLALAGAATAADVDNAVAEVLAKAAQDPGPSALAEAASRIDECFSADSVAGIRDRLQATDAEWARLAVAAMDRASPTGVAVAFRHVGTGRDRSFDQGIRQDFRLACRLLLEKDFHEGVRALVIDKDRNPAWSPAAPDHVAEADIDRLFAGIGEDLSFD
ncbi:enoyl-CoA hydratase/isomerase family protein [Magnetospirillum sp. UT-4]|uniref:enoyl-CoA hydratase/isomerase family protein n=1 Tax=Magnetospirillum sp. UT-4 TaxID=2681467 RepID=UPI00137FA3E6|nr:enoyl-CoA hydratase/isomerase family protein [Magnetospirillum sp. UT-4]CAA7617776.1 Enoyl-CoA hydratase/carnithine racemase [Magnetospirillum sp. UT-4]